MKLLLQLERRLVDLFEEKEIPLPQGFLQAWTSPSLLKANFLELKVDLPSVLQTLKAYIDPETISVRSITRHILKLQETLIKGREYDLDSFFELLLNDGMVPEETTVSYLLTCFASQGMFDDIRKLKKKIKQNGNQVVY